MTIAGSADDAGDLHFRIGLTVRALPQVVLAATEFDDAHLVALAVTLHGCDDFAATQERRADLDAVALPDQQHLVEFDVGAGLGRELFHAKDRAFADAILFATRRTYGVHVAPISGVAGDPAAKGRAVYGERRSLASFS